MKKTYKLIFLISSFFIICCADITFYRKPVISVTVSPDCHNLYKDDNLYIYLSRLGTDWDTNMYVDVGSTENIPVFVEGKYNIKATASRKTLTSSNYESVKSIYIYHGEERNVEFHCN
tara:strand:- start:590 stop:943 length:354 start_codon:yes stop_codon:yes gene_type:complete